MSWTLLFVLETTYLLRNINTNATVYIVQIPHFGDKSEIYWLPACSPQNVRKLKNSDQKMLEFLFVSVNGWIFDTTPGL